jgi:hypothetical protein
MLTQAQQDLVVAAIARLPPSDREPTLMALKAGLPCRVRVSDEGLLKALNQALKAETSGCSDADGIIPKIRRDMSPNEAMDIYLRTVRRPGPRLAASSPLLSADEARDIYLPIVERGIRDAQVES